MLGFAQVDTKCPDAFKLESAAKPFVFEIEVRIWEPHSMATNHS